MRTFLFTVFGGCGRTIIRLELKEDNTFKLRYFHHWMGSERKEVIVSGSFLKLNDNFFLLSDDKEEIKNEVTYHLIIYPFTQMLYNLPFIHTAELMDAGMLCGTFDVFNAYLIPIVHRGTEMEVYPKDPTTLLEVPDDTIDATWEEGYYQRLRCLQKTHHRRRSI